MFFLTFLHFQALFCTLYHFWTLFGFFCTFYHFSYFLYLLYFTEFLSTLLYFLWVFLYIPALFTTFTYHTCANKRMQLLFKNYFFRSAQGFNFNNFCLFLLYVARLPDVALIRVKKLRGAGGRNQDITVLESLFCSFFYIEHLFFVCRHLLGICKCSLI